MKKIMKKGICLFLILLMILPTVNVFAQTEDTPTVYIIGDSTAATYSEARAPRTGWGQVLHNFFKDGYMVKNYAQSGASAHSCYDSFWQSVKMQIKPNDYLLIQFGHNDSAQSGYDDEGNVIDSLYRWSDPTLDSSVVPPEGELTDNPRDYSYKWYLKQFADYAEGIGAHPIFVTSVERRDHAIERAEDEDSGLYPWVKAMKELATDELNIPVIDVWTEVRTLVKNMEKEKENSTKELYMHLQPGEYSYYPDGSNDNTHLSLTGALKVSGIFASLLKKTDISLKNYLVDDITSVTQNRLLPEKIDEDFYGAELGVIKPYENYNSWYVSGDSEETKSPYVQIVYEDKEKTNKAINFYRDATVNAAYDENILKATYTLKNPLGADEPADVTDEERYVRLKYKFRSDINASGFTVAAGGMQVIIEPSGSVLRVKRDTPTKVNKPISFGEYKSLTTGKWYNIEVYYDLKKQKISTFVDNNRLHTEENLASSKIENISMSSVRYVSSTIGTWSYLVDDIELSVIEEDTYCDYVGVLPDETYLFKETFNRYDEGDRVSGTWNGWTLNNPNNSVAMLKIKSDPVNTYNSDKALAFQRTGIPSGTNILTRTFSEALDNGYYELSFSILKHNENDKLFEFVVKDGESTVNTSNNSNIANGWKISFDLSEGTITIPYKLNDSYSNKTIYFNGKADEKITTDKWYNIKVIYDLTGDEGLLSFFLDGEMLAENVAPPNMTNTISDRYNKGKIQSLTLALNRSAGSTKGDDTKRDEYTIDEKTLIADVLIDDVVLRKVTTEPLSLIYSEDGAKVTGVKIKNERVAGIGEKLLVAVYSEDTVKGISECETITYGKTELALKTSLSVETGDVIKVFFWDVEKIHPKGWLTK